MQVACERTGDVWRLTLQPGAGEQTIALDPLGLVALRDILQQAASEHCRVLVLRGSREVFCAGADLQAMPGQPPDEVRQGCACFTDCLRRLRCSSFFTIAVVEGAAIGGGLGLIAASDLALALTSATFSLPELTLGLLPAMVLPALLGRMPPQKARLLALGGSLTADQARQIGLVDEVHTDRAALSRSLRRWLKQGLRTQPEAVAGLKDLGVKLEGLLFDDALSVGAQHASELFCCEACLEPVRRFRDGELPPWFTPPPRWPEEE